MSSRAGSTFVTFLMSIPFAAVGLMAVFGVPPLSSVIAASRGLNDQLQGFHENGKGSQPSPGSEFEDWDSNSAPGWSEEETDLSKLDAKARDETREVDDLGFSKPHREVKDGRSGGDRKSRGDSKKRDEVALLDEPLPSTPEKSRDSHFDDTDDKNSQPLSMKDSLKKLNSLGVKHYHLERGADQDTWLFVCLFSPGDDTRVTHRFEAESDEPEGAVAETLKQIDSWLLKRFRDKQPISQSPL